MEPESLKYKRKAKAIAKHWGCKCTKRRIGMISRTRKPCSCWMCGNPRHFDKGEEKITIQERKALDNYNDQLEEQNGT